MSPGSTTRRQLLLAGGASVLSALVVPRAIQGIHHDIDRHKAHKRRAALKPATTTATAAPTRAEVLTQAQRTAGERYLNSAWSAWVGSSPDAWSGVWVAWLLKDAGLIANAAAPAAVDVAPSALWNRLRGAGLQVAVPAAGDLIFYSAGPALAPDRVGIVVSTIGGIPQTLEGDQSFTLPHDERFVRRLARPGPGTVSFARPPYAA